MNIGRESFGPSASWDRLRLRAQMLRRLRDFFHTRGFLEVETPLLSRDTVIDLHLDPLPVTLFPDPRNPAEGPQFWLQTSPEFCMKRLLAANGPPAIFQVTRAFRGGECGQLHNPEFTMVEWYRVGDDYAAGMALLAELASDMLQAPDVLSTSYRDAFVKHAAIDPFDASNSEIVKRARKALGPTVPDYAEDDRDSWLNLLLAECVEPHLGQKQPEILYDYPASQAALARVRQVTSPHTQSSPATAAVAERFELYVRGMELANGYHELLDADLLASRQRRNNEQRTSAGKPPLPEANRLLDAMRSGLPACSGVALGFDRLVMAACGATSISEVMAFPIDRS
ncbi:MAG: Elongation factor P--(R)-beta-lysine ligase [Planctomycetota bacterium]